MKKLILLAISALMFAHFSSAEESEPNPGPRKKISTKREYQARKYLNTGKNKKVIELLNPYTDELSIPSYLDLANAYGNLNDITNEVRVLRILNDRDKENYESHFVLGNGLWRLLKATKKEEERKQIETDLVTAFRKAIQLAPKYKPSYDSLLNFFVGEKSNYEARQLLSQMVEQFGKRPELLNDQCRLFSIDGYLPQTVETCTSAIAIAKGYPDNYVYLGQAYIEKGDVDKGGKIIRMAAKKFPKKEITQWAAGKYYYDKQNYPVATRYFSAAVKANKARDRSQLGLGNSLFEEKKFEPALQHLLKACQLNQSHKEVLLVKATKLRLDRQSSLADKYKKTSFHCVSKRSKR